MEISLLDFNPFQALGLIPGIYVREGISRAFRLQSRLYHPDKSSTRGEIFKLLTAARDQLLNHCQDEYEEWGNEFLKLQHCKYCSFDVASESWIFHLLHWHRKRECSTCNSHVDQDSFENHMKEHSVLCPHYWDVVLKELLLEHLSEKHKFELCESCKEYTGEFSWHLKESHHYLQCLRCAQCYDAGVSREHISQSHDFQFCEVCEKPINIVSYTAHLRITHQWEECPYCEELVAENDLDNHVSSHQIKICHHCQRPVLQEDHDKHLLEEHEYLKYPFCGVLESYQALQSHIRSHHNSDPQEGHPGQETHQERLKVTDLLNLPEGLIAQLCEEAPDAAQELVEVIQQHMTPRGQPRKARRPGKNAGYCTGCHVHFGNLYDHHRLCPEYKKPAPTPKEPRVWCEKCDKTHSKSNLSRCPHRRKEREMQDK